MSNVKRCTAHVKAVGHTFDLWEVKNELLFGGEVKFYCAIRSATCMPVTKQKCEHS